MTNKIESAREWSIGYQVTGGPTTFQSAHEETVGTNWWSAVDKLWALANDWAANDWAANDDPLPAGYRRGDDLPSNWRPVTSDQLTTAWEANPPAFPHNASYELVSSEGVEIKFYLTGERP